MNLDEPAAHGEGPVEPPFDRPSRSARAVGDVRQRHGGRRVANGVTIASGVLVAAHGLHAIALDPYFPPGHSPWPAWLALAGVLSIGVVSRFFTATFPVWLYVVLLVGLAVPVWLDLQATAGLLPLGITPTAAAASGTILMPVAAIRGIRVPVGCAALIGLVLGAEAVIQTPAAGTLAVAGVAIAASAALPAAVSAIAIVGFRGLVGRELDLTLVQSTVATPRSAVGMRASEELARLDFDAEALLDDIGSGRLPLPLPDAAAERAGQLAARLRVRLIEGRTDTWLRHAVSESVYLSERVTIDDGEGCAGLLDRRQRDALLLALWMIAGEHRPRRAARAKVDVQCRTDPPDDVDPRDLLLTIDVAGVASRHLDPATWDAVGILGMHEIVSNEGSFRIEISCRIDPNVRAAAAAPRPGARMRGV